MKNLRDFLIESFNTETEINESNSKKITFDFTDLENGEETLKSLEGMEGVEIEDKKLIVTVDEQTAPKLDSVQEILNDYCHVIRNSTKRTSNENYAQKTKSFEDRLGDLMDAIDEIENPDVEDDKEDDKEGDE